MFTNPIKNVLEFGFTPGQKVADFGSGAGHYSLALAQAVGEKGRVYAVDVDKDMLVKLYNQSQAEGKQQLRVIVGNVEEEKGTHLADESVDGVVFSNLLFHVDDKPKVVKEALRILVPGWRLGLVEWSDMSYLSGLKSGGGRVLVSEPEAKELFIKNGFVFEKSFEAGEHHYGMIFKKPVVERVEEATEAEVLL